MCGVALQLLLERVAETACEVEGQGLLDLEFGTCQALTQFSVDALLAGFDFALMLDVQRAACAVVAHELALGSAPRRCTNDHVTSARRSRCCSHLKRILKIDRLRLRGLTGAADEFTLAAAVQNLSRLAKLTSHGPPLQGTGAPARGETLRVTNKTGHESPAEGKTALQPVAKAPFIRCG
jgi:hypothetical protein